MMQSISYDRYQRQMILKGFGGNAQQKLLDAGVLIIGAGGLGCPVLQYLAGAGIGTIGIIDDDMVSLENLHRQTLYSTSDIGFLKAEIAAEKLRALNPDISITPYSVRLSQKNCLDIFPSYDIILDCTDNFSTRYMINDACVLLGKPLVSGAVSQYEGQVAIFNCPSPVGEDPVNYRDLFPEPPKSGEVMNCAEVGVLGALPGIIGSIQAGETIKLITGIGEPLINRMFTYNLLNNQTYELILGKNKTVHKTMPLNNETFLQTDYEWMCGNIAQDVEIDAAQFNELRALENTLIIDVREYDEYPTVTEFPHLKIPLSELENNLNKLRAETIIFFCQAGSRSLKAVQMVSDKIIAKNILSLHGGIINWKKQ